MDVNELAQGESGMKGLSLKEHEAISHIRKKHLPSNIKNHPWDQQLSA